MAVIVFEPGERIEVNGQVLTIHENMEYNELVDMLKQTTEIVDLTETEEGMD